MERRNIEHTPDGISIEEHRKGYVIYEIPDDSENTVTMDVFCFEDIAISVIDMKHETIIPRQPIRFKSLRSGGKYPLITSELAVLPESFKYFKGQIPPEYDGSQEGESPYDSIYTEELFSQISEDEDKPRIKITNIPDDDSYESDMDIEIAQNGNVTLTIREIGLSRDLMHNNRQIIEERLLFKTKENGGRHPIMAFTLTKIAERILAAKRNSH